MAQLIISKDSFTYLVNQRGEFAHLANDQSAWYEAYYLEVQKTMDQIGFMPRHVLDIGSGLGVVDALLARDTGAYCTLIDGDQGNGICAKHDEPFCSRSAVERFFADNQVPTDRWRYLAPTDLAGAEPLIYDLVISLRSWCFHYAPEKYLKFVKEHACPGARLIIDVRKSRRDWRDTLGIAFHECYTVEEGAKHCRVVYVVRGSVQ